EVLSRDRPRRKTHAARAAADSTLDRLGRPSDHVPRLVERQRLEILVRVAVGSELVTGGRDRRRGLRVRVRRMSGSEERGRDPEPAAELEQTRDPDTWAELASRQRARIGGAAGHPDRDAVPVEAQADSWIGHRTPS